MLPRLAKYGDPSPAAQDDVLIDVVTRRETDLLHGHALGQVSWLVDVAAAADGDVVGEELEGDYFQDREEELVGLGDRDDVLD